MKKTNFLWITGIIVAVLFISRKAVAGTATNSSRQLTAEDERKFFYNIMNNMVIGRTTDLNILVLRQIKPELGFDMLLYDMTTNKFMQTPEMKNSIYSYNVIEVELNSCSMAFNKEELNKLMLSKIK